MVGRPDPQHAASRFAYRNNIFSSGFQICGEILIYSSQCTYKSRKLINSRVVYMNILKYALSNVYNLIRLGALPLDTGYPGPDLVVERGGEGGTLPSPRGRRRGRKGGRGVPWPPLCGRKPKIKQNHSKIEQFT